MYTIANKHNKKTRKLSSSSRNKHKSKSKNKRKHKYTIGKTRKYTKSHNTIHIGGTGEKKRLKALRQKAESERRLQHLAQLQDSDDEEQGSTLAVRSNSNYRALLSDPQQTAAQAALQSVTQRLNQRRQSQKQSGVTVSDSAPVLTPTSTQDNVDEKEKLRAEAAASSNPPPKPVIKLSPHRLQTSAQATVTNTTPTVSTPSTSDAEKLKTDAEAKKKEREAASLEMYNKFIDTINNCNFKTKTPNETPNEASYIQFSKFIQKIMGLQSSIKDDKLSKQAQTITDQILTAYSALISYECSKSLKKHFETYIGNLKSQKNIQKTIKIVDPTEPSLNIDEQVSTINEKLKELAKAQKCDHPSSQHLVEETVKDSNFRLRFPSFPSFTITNPFKKSSDSSDNDTELHEITSQNSDTSATTTSAPASANAPSSNTRGATATASSKAPVTGSSNSEGFNVSKDDSGLG